MTTLTRTIVALMFTARFSPPIPAMAANWRIDPARSTLTFSGEQTGTPFSGHLGSFNGTVSFDPLHPEAGHAHVTIALSSATTGDQQRDKALPGQDWFDVTHFPSAIFDAKNFRPKSGNTYETIGTLTIRGVSKSETLVFTINITDSTLHVKGHLDLLRSSFGVGQGPWATGQWVALEVGVNLDIIAQKKN